MKRLFILSFYTALVFNSRAQKNNLDYFINQAITNSPLLKDYQNQVLSFSLDSQIIRASLKPQVNGISNNSYAPIIKGWGYDEVISNGQQISALVQVSKSFLSNKTIASQIANLQLQSQAIANTIKISEQDVIKAITDQYIVTYGEQLQLDFNYEINNLLKKEDSLLKKLTQDNVFKQNEYLAFVVTLQQQLLATSQLEMQYNFDYAAMNYLAGIIDTTTTRLQDPQLNSKAFGDFNSSVFYRQFVLDSLKLANDRMLIDLSYRPKINAYGDAGYNSSLTYRPYKNFGTSVGVNLTIPIYDGRQKKLQYAKIDIQERTRIFKRDFFILQRNQQMLQLIQQLNATDRFIDQINKQIKYTETLITVNERLLATGDIRLTDFILTLNNYFNAKNLVTQNYITRLKIVNQLNYWGR
ncbi:MAG TPA: TolC family protein [Chitinophagaceae bacterium]|nr:TolC family protein [Chitinophagaceae bacterium]